MIAMSTHSVPWRSRVGRVLRSITPAGWVGLGILGIAVVMSGMLHPSLPGFLLMALGCSVVVGQKN